MWFCVTLKVKNSNLTPIFAKVWKVGMAVMNNHNNQPNYYGHWSNTWDPNDFLVHKKLRYRPNPIMIGDKYHLQQGGNNDN